MAFDHTKATDPDLLQHIREDVHDLAVRIAEAERRGYQIKFAIDQGRMKDFVIHKLVEVDVNGMEAKRERI